ncbi:MAG TPA: ankyrin repeat domain-containing protein [Terriglobia bacterium]|jgi:ankyrin repeat protein
MRVKRPGFAVVIALLMSVCLFAEEGKEGSVNADGTSPLHWAVRADDAPAVDRLLRSGADAKAADRYGVTSLYLAAVNGNAAIIGKLLDAGADPNSKDPAGETTLMTAARTGTPDALKALLERGANVNAVDPEFQQTALMLAVRENHPAAVQLLIERGAELNAHTRSGETPAFRPPCKGTGCGSEGVGINRGGLPDRGIRAAITGGLTSLLYAARDGRPEAARLLVDAHADVNLADPNGISPLLMSIMNGHLDVARFLLDHGAGIETADFWGRTPLWAAVDLRNMELDHGNDVGVDRAPVIDFIKLLVDRGANVNVRTKEVPPGRRWLYSLGDVSWVDMTGQTPFLRAALSGDAITMRFLLDHGADPNLATLGGTTPLMAAAGVNWTVAQTYTVSKESLLEAVKICLEKGADVNATNSMGLTAVMGAANRGSDDIIKFLAEHGARVDVKDASGRTAVTWAEGVFLASVGAERKPTTVALLQQLMGNGK